MKYDWGKDWYAGSMPPAERRSFFRQHPAATFITMLLAVAALVMWGIS